MDDSNDDATIHLTIRLIMQGKEVGSIIGKKGEIVKRFREESGAKINISDGSCPERIVTVTGTNNSIFKAFTLICKKFEEEMQNVNAGLGVSGKQPITLRLIVPASQCGSLIGKGGSKIKEIREVTGASIQVASEMLPNSTERCVTISGSSDSITQCIYHICCVMLESPPKGATIPYRPKPQVAGPVILAGGQAYTLQGNYAVPAHDNVGQLGGGNPLASLAALGLPALNTGNSNALNPAALAALAGSQLRTGSGRGPTSQQQTHEMTVPNELIGCIIGKGGTKIAEIRQISGAVIRINKSDERDQNEDRVITISGPPEAVTLAQYLINMSVELQKANLESNENQQSTSTSSGNNGTGGSTNPGGSAGLAAATTTSAAAALSSALPLAQLLAKPGTLSALHSLQALGGLTDLLGLNMAAGASQVQTTGVHRPQSQQAHRGSGGGGSSRGRDQDDRRATIKHDSKYSPY